jgi:hypothetical protein
MLLYQGVLGLPIVYEKFHFEISRKPRHKKGAAQ